MAKIRSSTKESANDFFEVYKESATNLRLWLIYYGIGGPVLILSNDSLFKSIVASQNLNYIGILFLAGVGLQVLLAWLNKTIMWHCYWGDANPPFQETWYYKMFTSLSDKIWIDIGCEIGSFVLFAIATVKLILSINRI